MARRLLQAVYPAAALETPRSKSVSISQITNEITQNPESTWDPPLDLSHLSESRRQMVQQMLREEAASFSRSDDDIGCIEGLQLNISLKDTTPVTRTYQSVPRPLYEEMKDYLHDLIAQGWFRSQTHRIPHL